MLEDGREKEREREGGRDHNAIALRINPSRRAPVRFCETVVSSERLYIRRRRRRRRTVAPPVPRNGGLNDIHRAARTVLIHRYLGQREPLKTKLPSFSAGKNSGDTITRAAVIKRQAEGMAGGASFPHPRRVKPRRGFMYRVYRVDVLYDVVRVMPVRGDGGVRRRSETSTTRVSARIRSPTRFRVAAFRRSPRRRAVHVRPRCSLPTPHRRPPAGAPPSR